MSLQPGTRLGHYNVTALLGEGGMGQVWQATDTQLNRQVALTRQAGIGSGGSSLITPPQVGVGLKVGLFEPPNLV